MKDMYKKIFIKLWVESSIKISSSIFTLVFLYYYYYIKFDVVKWLFENTLYLLSRDGGGGKIKITPIVHRIK